MLKKKIYNLLLCLSAAISVSGVLYALSIDFGFKRNGFIRSLPPHKVIGFNSIDIKYNSWYLLGGIDRQIFLGNYIVPGKVAKVNESMNKYNEFNVKGFENASVNRGAYLQIDSPFFYLLDGITPLILKGYISDFRLIHRLKTSYFTGSVPLTSNTSAMRFVNTIGQNILAKFDFEKGSLKNTHLLEKQIDGLFCTDGEMVKVPGSSKMIYIYYYRNQFLLADSNLTLLYKGKTIDTISRARIKISKIRSTGTTTMSSPPLNVNKRASANSKYLFIQSALRANNETNHMIKDVSMIDVYSIIDGKYQFSFYLPDFKGFKIRDFKVYGRSLYALYDHYLYKYQLNFN